MDLRLRAKPDMTTPRLSNWTLLMEKYQYNFLYAKEVVRRSPSYRTIDVISINVVGFTGKLCVTAFQ